MADWSELKRLAEAANPGPWSTECDELYWHEDGYTKHLMETYEGADLCHDGEHLANLKFIAAANPAAVLALIAENERLKMLRSKTERELEQELEVWRNGPSCWSCGDSGDVHHLDGEWLGECDCFAAQLINANRDHDQLKAENERLQASLQGYQMGAQAEAEEADRLRGEVKELRKDAERYRWLRAGKNYAHQYLIDLGMENLEGFDRSIDAAMAKESRP